MIKRVSIAILRCIESNIALFFSLTHTRQIKVALRLNTTIEFRSVRNVLFSHCDSSRAATNPLAASRYVFVCALYIQVYSVHMHMHRVHIEIAQIRSKPAFVMNIRMTTSKNDIICFIVMPLLPSISFAHAIALIFFYLIIVLVRKRNCHCCVFIVVLHSQAKIQFSIYSMCVCMSVFQKETKTER